MTFNQLLTILRARWVLLASIFFGVVLSVLVLSLILPKKYTATAAVVIDVKSPDPMVGMVLPGMMAPGYIATQLDVLQSERVVKKAIKKLGIDQSPLIRTQWAEATESKGDFETWLAALIQSGIDIKPSRESSVINVSYVGADPAFAAAMANALVQSYIETVLELRVEPAKQYSALFADQAKAARDKFEEAQSRLSAFQKERGILATDERMDVETARLNELSSQLVAMQTAAADSSSRVSAVSANSPEVLNSAVVATLKSDLSRGEARLQELSARLGAQHPQVQEQQASNRETKQRLDAEIARVTSSIGINNTVNQAREAQVRRALDQQREKILRLKEQRDEASVLLRDVESAQRAYETIMARQNQASVESQTNQTNVSVLKQAYAPSSHSSPKTLINLILAIMVGGMLAFGVTLMVELRDRKIRTEQDVVEGLELPLLGEMPEAFRISADQMGSGVVKPALLPGRGFLARLEGPKG
jgi:polysaccharide biosynthesis transport protein